MKVERWDKQAVPGLDKRMAPLRVGEFLCVCAHTTTLRAAR
jgi:hypothetical protein